MNKAMQSAYHVCVQFEDRRSGFTVMRDFTVEQEKRLDGSISIPQIKDEVGRRLRLEGISESFCVLNIQPLEETRLLNLSAIRTIVFTILLPVIIATGVIGASSI